jgi:hypothetical protein
MEMQGDSITAETEAEIQDREQRAEGDEEHGGWLCHNPDGKINYCAEPWASISSLRSPLPCPAARCSDEHSRF